MSEPTSKPANMGLQLFPPPPKKAKPSRKQSTRSHTVTPQSAVERSESPLPPSDGRQSALDGRQSAMGERQTPQTQTGRASPSPAAGRQTPQQTGRASPSPAGGRQTPQQMGRASPSPAGGRSTPQMSRATPSPITVPSPAVLHSALDIPRSHTSFSEAPTLVRSNSNGSHNSIAKNLPNTNASPQRSEQMMHSIFPRYNPQLPLEHQQYFPTQTSPTHIPKTVINRRPYSPSLYDERNPLQSPMAVGLSPGRFPRGIQDETIMEPSTNDEMKELWKVTNGWRVSASEGRSFCLKMSSNPEEPVYTLSSATQNFYTLRLDPTSTSAQMTMTRQDPNKIIKESSKLGALTSSKPNTGMEVMSTTLEESARRLPPNDGLVALLYPRAASNMVIDLASKPSSAAHESSVLAAAERECGRLVWDQDSNKYYLVHPAIATPFRVSVCSSPAWSRVEYTLEHSELPRNLVRLVRDGAGGGWLEIDTAVAAKIDCFYIVDVAICAIMLVAVEEEKTRNVERFEAPPSIAPLTPKSPASRSSRVWGKVSKKGKRGEDTDVKIEEFEMDLESQSSMKEKMGKGEKEKIPGFFGLIWMLIKCFVWTLTTSVKALAKCIIFVSKCLTKKSAV